jgi:hypothetical protein
MNQSTRPNPATATPRKLDLALEAARLLAEDLADQAPDDHSEAVARHIVFALEDLAAIAGEIADPADTPVVVT